MNLELERQWKSSAVPFDGMCLHLDNLVALSELCLLMIPVVEQLRLKANGQKIYQFDDWHEHDGYITEAHETSWEFIHSALSSEESLRKLNRNDSYVRWACYPSDFSFLLRCYVIDEMEHPDSTLGNWGQLDLCASTTLLDDIKANSESPIAGRLVLSNAKEYFDRAWGG
jgi:hypothetical protein